MNILHSAYPNYVAFSLFGLDIRWYGIILALAILIGFILILKIAKEKQVDTNHFYNLFFLFVFFGLVGGRLGHVIAEWSYYCTNLLQIPKIWEGGLAIHGVIIGSIITLFLYSRYKKISFWLISDIIIVILPLMQAIGRWGNYFNQEIFGTPSNSAWSIPIAQINRPAGFESYEFFHPLFLYESGLMLLVFLIMVLLFRSEKLKTGQLTLVYFILFSVVRFCLEFLRIEAPVVWWLNLGQWVSLLFFVMPLIILLRKSGQIRKGKVPVQ
ncbi:prolipoprotein diacylglyceryl transferase [Patescibacteria group bacterium]|nr:prolipoprotein diacylglyceryl transferase [Patescibacteria group bacterium]